MTIPTSENQEIRENPILNPGSPQGLRFTEILTEEPPKEEEQLRPEAEAEEGDSAEVDGEYRGRHAKRENVPATRKRRAVYRRPASSGKHAGNQDSVSDGKNDRPPPPKTKPPDFSEWHGFMSDFALKWICRGYVGWAFSGIERERILNAQELKAIEPSEEMLSTASKPLAHMANRSKTLTKHGRFIIDSADGLESIIALGMWANTVRRIAKNHEKDRVPREPKQKKGKVPNDQTPEPRGENVPAEPRPGINGHGIGLGGFGAVPGVGG